MNKAVLPKEIAELIKLSLDSLSSDNKLLNDYQYILYQVLYYTEDDKDEKWLNEGDNLEVLVKAIKYGYEVEKTPEEKLLEMYNEPNHNERSASFRYGVEVALNTLGITVKGINDK